MRNPWEKPALEPSSATIRTTALDIGQILEEEVTELLKIARYAAYQEELGSKGV